MDFSFVSGSERRPPSRCKRRSVHSSLLSCSRPHQQQHLSARQVQVPAKLYLLLALPRSPQQDFLKHQAQLLLAHRSSTKRRAQPASGPSLHGQASNGAPPQAVYASRGGPPPAAPSSSGGAHASWGPPAPIIPVQELNPAAIVVSRRQEGNPILRHIRAVRWLYGDIIPDYQLGPTTCAIFISLRFHLLKPEYLHHRIRELQRAFRLRLVLCSVDVEDTVEPLHQVTKTAILNGCTLFCGFSHQECARYLETFKAYETKPADAIQGRTDDDYLSKLNAALTTVRGVNRTDVLTLGRTFGSVANLMKADMEALSACPGIGPTKIARLYETLHEPFRRSLRPQQLQNQAQEQADTATAEQAANAGAVLPTQRSQAAAPPAGVSTAPQPTVHSVPGAVELDRAAFLSGDVLDERQDDDDEIEVYDID